MKFKTFIIYFFLIFQISLFALNINPTSTIEYKKALSAFQNKDYQKSFQLFNDLLTNYPQNENINFYYGRSAFELENYEFAFTAYDKILIYNPMNHRVRLEYGRTLLMLKAYKEAKEEFEKVLASPIPAPVRKNVEKFLQVIEKANKQYLLNQVVIFSFGWDDNINNNTYEDITIVDTLPLTNDTDKNKDTNLKITLVNKFIKPFKNSKYSFESTSVLYLQEQNKYEDDDIHLISLNNGIGYTTQDYKHLLSLTYDHIWLGNNENMYIYGVEANSTAKVLEKDLVTFKLSYKNKNMTEAIDIGKESTIKGGTLGYKHTLSNKDKLELEYSLMMERKKQNIQVDISKDTQKYNLSYTRYFNEDLNLKTTYEYEEKKFKDVGFGLPKRVDKQHKFALKLSKKLDKSKLISLEYAHIDTKSNINTYSYKKNTANINYMIIF